MNFSQKTTFTFAYAKEDEGESLRARGTFIELLDILIRMQLG